MKLTLALSAFVFSASALATSTPVPTPPASTSASSSESSATAGATAGGGSATGGNASGGSVGNVSATGGGGGASESTSHGGAGGSSFSAGGQGGSSESYSGDVSSTIGGARYLSLPQPVWTTVPTPYGCLVSESKAGAILFNAFSGSSSSQHSDAVCTTVRMAEAAYLHCQYATAAFLNKRAFEVMHAGESGDFFLSGQPQNIGPVACDLLKRPTLRMSPVIQPAAQVAPTSASVSIDLSSRGQSACQVVRKRVKPAPMCK